MRFANFACITIPEENERSFVQYSKRILAFRWISTVVKFSRVNKMEPVGSQATMMTTATRTAKNKSNRFRLAKKPFARASRFFLLFFPSLHDYDAKRPEFHVF